MLSRKQFHRVLITGTTSGIGRAMLAHYHRHGIPTVAVNRREVPALWDEFPGIELETLDITCKNSVHGFLGKLVLEERCPDLFILSAGINRPDNFDGLDFDTFHEVMRTNLYGVMSFVGALHDLGLREKTVAVLSSTSNIVPNPSHVGYYLSKKSLHESFRLLRRKDPFNHYKSVVLGPVRTNIAGKYAGPQGWQGKLFEALSVSSEEAAVACATFFESSRSVAYYPFTSWLFYEAAGAFLSLFPSAYGGSIRQES